MNSNDQDRILIAKACRGDDLAFTKLMKKYRDGGIRYCYRFLGDFQLAEDVVQEGFINLFHSLHRYKERGRFSTFFFKILTNLCIDTLHRKRVRRTVTSDDPPDAVFEGPGPGDQAEYRELKAKVNRVLGLLDRNHRAILCLRDIQGHSCLDIADILRCTHATARWRLHRARIKFKEAWEKEYGAFEENV